MPNFLIPHQARPPLFLLSTFLGCLTGIGFILFYKLNFNLTDNLLWYGIPAALFIWVVVRLKLKPALARSSVFILGTLLFFISMLLIMQGKAGEFNLYSIVSSTKGHLNIYCFVGILLLIMSGFDFVSMSPHLSKLFVVQLLSYFFISRYLTYFSLYDLILWIPLIGAILVEIIFLAYKEINPRKSEGKKP